MVPLRVTLEGFLSYREKQVIDFEGSSLWMLWGPNGVTKLNLVQAEILFEELPIIQEAQSSKTPLTIFVNRDVMATAVPTIIHRVEKVADHYRSQVQPLTRSKNGQILLTREIVGKIVHLVKSQRRTESPA
jgi:hypothetical protein